VLRKFYPEEKGPITNIDPIGNSPVIIQKVWSISVSSWPFSPFFLSNVFYMFRPESFQFMWSYKIRACWKAWDSINRIAFDSSRVDSVFPSILKEYTYQPIFLCFSFRYVGLLASHNEDLSVPVYCWCSYAS
jgi:hypothetical protein